MARAPAVHRPRRTHRADDRRRRTAGGPDLGVAPAGRNERLSEIIAIVDHNKLQSDSAVAAVSDLGPLDDKFRAFGWRYAAPTVTTSGHPRRLRALCHDTPIARRSLIADTIKGKGVSFMEGLACGEPDLSLSRRRADAEGLPGGPSTS